MPTMRTRMTRIGKKAMNGSSPDIIIGPSAALKGIEFQSQIHVFDFWRGTWGR